LSDLRAESTSSHEKEQLEGRLYEYIFSELLLVWEISGGLKTEEKNVENRFADLNGLSAVTPERYTEEGIKECCFRSLLYFQK